MKLIINKDHSCIKCNTIICCTNKSELEYELEYEQEHHYCYHCGEPIEWIAERTVEEILEELMINTRLLGGRDIKDNPKETMDIANTVDSLKQELLNKINK